VSQLVDGVDYFVLVVEDDGPGIPKEDQERIFRRGEQSRPQEGDQRIGKGLGLYVVGELVNQLRATIELHSEVGKGARFLVRFPCDASVDV
jgi:two-component system, OmpR family, sensor histidine kinase ArlS